MYLGVYDLAIGLEGGSEALVVGGPGEATNEAPELHISSRHGDREEEEAEEGRKEEEAEEGRTKQ